MTKLYCHEIKAHYCVRHFYRFINVLIFNVIQKLTFRVSLRFPVLAVESVVTLSNKYVKFIDYFLLII